ncbi:MAG TPA: hypothetical protein GX522_09150 [Firmicutes bacterium]|nr:hypothetical protein [Bacillota bacterium]
MDNRLFIVAILEGELLKRALFLQKLFAAKYHLYKGSLPPLHITLDVVDAPEKFRIEKTREAVQEASQELNPFNVKTTGFACFPPPYKSLGLLIKKNEELHTAVGKIRNYLARKRISTLNPFGEDWIFHLTLVNKFLADREWTEKEFFEACNIVEDVPLDLAGQVVGIAIWHPIKDVKLMNEGTFFLKKQKSFLNN